MNCYFCNNPMLEVGTSTTICHEHPCYVYHANPSTHYYESIDFTTTINGKEYLIFYFLDNNTSEICSMPSYDTIAQFNFLLKLTPENAAEKLKTYLTFL